MALPVDFQNCASSGFQSEIHVGFRLLINVFLSGSVNARQQTPPPGARKRFSQGGGVACSVHDKTHGACSGDRAASALQASCQLRLAGIKSQ
jgi:hypothetical protein